MTTQNFSLYGKVNSHYIYCIQILLWSYQNKKKHLCTMRSSPHHSLTNFNLDSSAVIIWPLYLSLWLVWVVPNYLFSNKHNFFVFVYSVMGVHHQLYLLLKESSLSLKQTNISFRLNLPVNQSVLALLLHLLTVYRYCNLYSILCTLPVSGYLSFFCYNHCIGWN